MKIVALLTLTLSLTTSQTAFAAQEREESRDARDIRERRPAEDMRERRPAEDMRERRDSSSQRATDRPWRDTLAKCREMKKAGKLPRAMKEECKAARELRKKSRQ